MAKSSGNRGGGKSGSVKAGNRGGGNQGKPANWPSKNPGKLSGPRRTNNPHKRK